jgi:hypothetical protein
LKQHGLREEKRKTKKIFQNKTQPKKRFFFLIGKLTRTQWVLNPRPYPPPFLIGGRGVISFEQELIGTHKRKIDI